MFPSQTGLFSKIICPSIELKTQCGMLNCVFLHPDEESNDVENKKEGVDIRQKDAKLPVPIANSLKRPIDTTSDVTKKQKVSLESENHEDNTKQDTIPAPIATAPKIKEIKLSKEQLRSKEIENLLKIDQDIELIPKVVAPFPPAQVNVRYRYLTLLQHLYQTASLEFPNRDAVLKEYEIASTATNRTYEAIIKREIYQMANPEMFPHKMNEDHSDKKLLRLYSLVSDKKKLSQNGYVTDIPDVPADFTIPNVTKCDRCKQDFDISKIFQDTQCLYHPERFVLSRKTKGSHASNDINSKYYPCCNKPMGESEGCTVRKHHVFKLQTPQQLHHMIPFVSSESFNTSPTKLEAIALDCEMGYTTMGFELIRITMVDYFTEKTLYDKVVKPLGEVVDLNTYWSGVLEINEDAPTFQVFLKEIEEFIDSDTILIGHSLENDLTVMRLVHNKVIDTSLMFMNGLKKRSLKDVTFEYLSKKIQSGEHDSEEDARSCIGLIKWQIDRLIKLN